tara:strand:- start:2546 stop:2773 length:228 start_codon:yes stop_codon:yes gene_type:complete
MIKSKEYKNKGIEIDLTGPQGNAFYLLGVANRWAKELQFSDSYRKEMLEEMKSSDYENLIKVFDDNFGSIVTLYR